MGLVGINGIEKCDGLGDDGIMLNTPSPRDGCQASYPRFLSLHAGVNDPQQTANDFACIATLGTDGCGFEQQLEAGSRRCGPVDIDPETGGARAEPHHVPCATPTASAARPRRHATTPASCATTRRMGLSLIAIVVVTDEEDCSSRGYRALHADAVLRCRTTRWRCSR